MTLRQPDFPISIAGHLLPLIAVLDRGGSPWWRALGRAGLPTEVADPQAFLPTCGIMRFIDDMARREGLPDLGWRASQIPVSGAIHPLLRQRLAQAPSLYAMLRVACESTDLQGTNLRLWLQRSHDELWFCHAGSVPASLPGAEQGEHFRLGQAIRIIRSFLGETWQPLWLWLASSRPLPQPFVAYLGDCEIKRGMPYGVIPFPLHQIAAAPEPAAHSSFAPPPGDDWLDRVKAVLPSYLASDRLTVPLMAEIAGLSPRNFQRLLAERGTSHRALLESARFEQARRMLSETGRSITEIARLTGYTDPSNFARAFHRLAGRSPTEFRKDLQRRPDASPPGPVTDD